MLRNPIPGSLSAVHVELGPLHAYISLYMYFTGPGMVLHTTQIALPANADLAIPHAWLCYAMLGSKQQD